jgi:hypothetical protein
MNKKLQTFILKTTESEKIKSIHVIQNLWSNYGQIIRAKLINGNVNSVVVKHVQAGKAGVKEVNQSFSHRRKVFSYQVETNWYRHYSSMCKGNCRVPELLGFDQMEEDVVLLLEDLNESGFTVRKSYVTNIEMKTCLSWLANFHATFLGEKTKGLWEAGTYWHLETRPEELEKSDDISLKNAAHYIDHKLRSARFQTLVHGDAKLANFCFSEDSEKVAAVDFQYTGGGIGMKDVAYFISSCLDESISDKQEKDLLDFYFSELKSAVIRNGKIVNTADLEEEWRNLYYLAWTDFYRFWKGWASGYRSKDSYSERVKNKVLAKLKS